MISVIFLGIAHATICKVSQAELPCTPAPTINYRTYNENDQDCSGTSTDLQIWTDHMWGACESSQVETIGRILRCTGNENTIEVEEYDSKYCLASPSRTYTISKDACTLYREPDGDLVYRKFTWTYNGDIVCPSGDALIAVVKYGNEGCESGRSGEWVEMIPRYDTCFNSTTPNTFTDIRRSVTCNGGSGTIIEYSDASDPYENCTSSSTSLEITNGECVEWTDPTDTSYSEYRRMYFNCDRGSATALTIFWLLIFSVLLY